MLFGKQVTESPYMNDTPATSTSNEALAVVGDWSNFVIARRGGMSVELEAHRAAAQKKIDDIDEQLADLGFTAK
jgi:HK97 family phage major capsid protein